MANLELRFDHIKKNYGDKQALRGVSFTLNEGIYGLFLNGEDVAMLDAPDISNGTERC